MELEQEILGFIPRERVHADPLSLSAVAADASFYRLRPRLIVDAGDEGEVARVLEVCARWGVPATFRAAGTSLSGQAQGEGVIIRLSRGWRRIRVLDGGARIALEPGVVGAHANAALRPFRRRIGPDPASIQSCMIGGIAANNASGMCCGIDQNSYRTMEAVKLLLAPRDPGAAVTRLDTADPASRERFRMSQTVLLGALTALRSEVLADSALCATIERKYRIKNTLGYSINALLDHEDPIDILARLMIGSEGTLGFISEITYRTVNEPAHRSCALVFFASLAEACGAAARLRRMRGSAPGLAAVELMDRASLRSVEHRHGMPAMLKTLPSGAAALLVEVRAESSEELAALESRSGSVLAESPLLVGARFSRDPLEIEAWWEIRRGLFPAVGRARPKGTTVIIEDVAVPVENLAQASEELIALLEAHGYRDAIVYGHALDGNLHFVCAQNFGRAEEVERYAKFMDALAGLIAERWKGSLKAEHGTGRNMAPFVEREWGPAAYSVMKRLKAAIDPLGILNPGVILNEDPRAHVDALKSVPPVDPQVDSCIECGFCEVRCPSKDYTLTPRQRIAAYRERARDPHSFPAALLRHPVEESCAGDGLCSLSCPVGIDTGAFVRRIRAGEVTMGRDPGLVSRIRRLVRGGVAGMLARRWGLVLSAIRMLLFLRRVLPLSGRRNSLWRWIPGPARLPEVAGAAGAPGTRPRVVYLPSCLASTLGAAPKARDARPLPQVMRSLLEKAGFDVIVPADAGSLCCGLALESKGLREPADFLLQRFAAAIDQASEGGAVPILTDTSPCVLRATRELSGRVAVRDPVEFLHAALFEAEKAGRIRFEKRAEPVLIHSTCSSKHLGTAPQLKRLAEACTAEVIVPDGIECCGFAGDKGIWVPGLGRAALAALPASVPKGCGAGYSSSRTCEIGLSRASGVPYQSIVYLLDECVRVCE